MPPHAAVHDPVIAEYVALDVHACDAFWLNAW